MDSRTTVQRGATAALALAVALAIGIAGCARKPAHAGFDAPEAAVEALVKAGGAGDVARLRELFGPDSEAIVSSGDEVADRNARERFVALYAETHDLVHEGDDRAWLQVGSDAWPFPVPLVRRDGKWSFDGAEGADEIAYRRIGRNELGAIAVMRGFVDAEREYATTDHDGEGAGVYAHKLVSDPGTHNGLYWPSGEGEPESPVGDFVAAAAAEGYKAGGATYHGYRFRPLFRQTDNASGGAIDYFDKGVLKNGFALLAWPADYGAGGVMTFIINQDGVVFQKDLGEGTEAAVAAIDAYDPDPTWIAVLD